VVRLLDAALSLQPILDGLEGHGTTWIAAGGPSEIDRRELAAATFALEAARTGAWKAWKLRVDAPTVDESPPRFFLDWQPPAHLLEWGCARLRARGTPHPAERLWQLAAISVAQRAEDYEFLNGDGEQTDVRDYAREIEHLRHVRQRFPDEPRFKLAQVIAAEWQASPAVRRGRPQAARDQFADLRDDPDIGAEATLRLGRIAMTLRDDDRAREAFERVESLTRDPWTLYLARLFRGTILERRGRTADAERAYRGALEAVPRAQAAATALAALLARQDRRSEASTIVEEMLAASPAPPDPWRGYVNADDRFWPALIARLREEIRR
jgi:tetratricopeptide (TPR) repeat protein